MKKKPSMSSTISRINLLAITRKNELDVPPTVHQQHLGSISDRKELANSQVSWRSSPQKIFFYNVYHLSKVVSESVIKTEINIIHDGYVEFNFIIITVKYILITLLEAYF